MLEARLETDEACTASWAGEVSPPSTIKMAATKQALIVRVVFI
jgi:hypothetical protein